MVMTIKGRLIANEKNHIMMKFSDKVNIGRFWRKGNITALECSRKNKLNN